MLRGQCVEAAIHLARQLEGCNGEVCRRVAPMPVPNLSAPPTFLVNLYDQTATCCRAEWLIDMMINAPHIICSVVMPGHIGTSILLNTRKVQSGNQADAMDATQLAQARARVASMGRDASSMSDDDIRQRVAERERRFREEAPTSASEAVTIILNGVKADLAEIGFGFEATTGVVLRGTESLLTHRWRETDSNFRSPEETTFSRPPRSSFESPPSGRGDSAPVSTRGERAFRASPSASSADANNCERGRRWLQSVQGGPWSQVGGKGRARSPWGEGEAGTQALG